MTTFIVKKMIAKKTKSKRKKKVDLLLKNSAEKNKSKKKKKVTKAKESGTLPSRAVAPEAGAAGSSREASGAER